MQRSQIAGFDWDEGNRTKCQKHGVTLAEIEAVFRHPHRIMPDTAHSDAETRFLAVGSGGGPRPVFLAFTLRQVDGATHIRPISARYMHRKEIEHYEQAAPPSDH
ncbi:BrnT family toxin [Novosphingobium cyanobacteriorum]|uniref:BrnT family toxin n=1 Tax=Novosphingobium cyanobacteriorum TaxID=3024215 RepID=A0ABT6CDP9_9SPHN|nr:BrnT family toxin [Novosphingobium cyanobacteriorum]MDF8332049.1 BrnT family toxin [Novosphingobium cyanobacteriorum]